MRNQIQLCIPEIAKKENIHMYTRTFLRFCVYVWVCTSILCKSLKVEYFYSEDFLCIKLQKIKRAKIEMEFNFLKKSFKYFTCDISIFNAHLYFLAFIHFLNGLQRDCILFNICLCLQKILESSSKCTQRMTLMIKKNSFLSSV